MPTNTIEFIVSFKRTPQGKTDRDAFVADPDQHAWAQADHPEHPHMSPMANVRFEVDPDPAGNPKRPVVLLRGRENALVRSLISRMGFQARPAH